MKQLIAFDLDGTLAESKQPLKDDMGDALADLLGVANVAVISGGDWPQFNKQVASRLPMRADLSKLWLMPTTGTKLYIHRQGEFLAVEIHDPPAKRFLTVEIVAAKLFSFEPLPKQHFCERQAG